MVQYVYPNSRLVLVHAHFVAILHDEHHFEMWWVYHRTDYGPSLNDGAIYCVNKLTRPVDKLLTAAHTEHKPLTRR